MKRIISIFAAFICALGDSRHAAAADKPNVLFIMSDDLRACGGVFTRELVKTPNLDRLRHHAQGCDFELHNHCDAVRFPGSIHS